MKKIFVFFLISLALPCRAEVASRAGVVRAFLGKTSDNAYGIAVQTDGKVLVAGASHNGKDNDAVLLRFLPDGSLDTRFGVGGAATFDSKKGDDKAYSVAVWWDGKIYLSGEVSNGKDSDFAVWKFLSDGKIDKKFGKDGLARADFGKGDDIAYTMVVQTDGKVILGGTAMGKEDKDFAMAKFIKDGAPDINFGLNGKIITSLGDLYGHPGDESGYGLVQLPEGRIVQIGSSEIQNKSVMSVVRYFGDGRLDQGFGKKGILFPSFPGMETRAYASAVDSQRRTVIAGNIQQNKKRELVVIRVLPSGQIDTEFGDDGKTVIPMPGTHNVIYGVAFDNQKRIVLGGGIGDADRMQIFTGRLDENGKVDTTFGNNGTTTYSDGKYDVAFAVALQQDGKIISAGVTKQGETYQVALLRYMPNGDLDPYFGLGARAIQSVGTTDNSSLPKSFFLPKPKTEEQPAPPTPTPN